MVNEHRLGSAPIGTLDLLPDVLSLLITDSILIRYLSPLSLLLNLVPIGKCEDRCCNQALQAAHDKVEKDHFHGDLLRVDVHVCVLNL